MKEKTPIKKHGVVFGTDSDGYIINHLTKEHIQTKWMPVIEDTVTLCKETFGENLRSIFVRGSVAAGNAIAGYSDIDFILIFANMPPEDINKDVDQIAQNVESQYSSFLSKVELVGAEEDNIRRPLKLMIATQSVCVYGTDISKDMEKIHISEAHQHRENIQKEVENTLAQLNEIDDENSLQKKERWIFSRLIRALYEHIMVEANVYTRSLYYNYENFSEFYPQYESDIYNFLEHAINPTGDRNGIKKDLEKGLGILKDI